MNSVAIIETEENGRELHYLVAVLSNVLRKNSVHEHRALAARIHQIVRSQHPLTAPSAVGAPSGPGAD